MALLPVVLSLDSDGGVENQRGDQVCTVGELTCQSIRVLITAATVS